MGVGWGLDQELQVNPSRANGCGMGRRGENRKWEDNTLQLTLNRQRGGECGGGDACVKAGAQSGEKCAGGDVCIKAGSQARSKLEYRYEVRRQLLFRESALTLYLVLRQGLSLFLPFFLILRASWPRAPVHFPVHLPSHATTHGFVHELWEPDCGGHACTARVSPAEPFFQPETWIFVQTLLNV